MGAGQARQQYPLTEPFEHAQAAAWALRLTG